METRTELDGLASVLRTTLGSNPKGLTSTMLAAVPVVNARMGERVMQRKQTRINHTLMYMEKRGHVIRAKKVPSGRQNTPAILWKLTPAGRKHDAVLAQRARDPETARRTQGARVAAHAEHEAQVPGLRRQAKGCTTAKRAEVIVACAPKASPCSSALTCSASPVSVSARFNATTREPLHGLRDWPAAKPSRKVGAVDYERMAPAGPGAHPGCSRRGFHGAVGMTLFGHLGFRHEWQLLTVLVITSLVAGWLIGWLT